jgi:competence protein ComEC
MKLFILAFLLGVCSIYGIHHITATEIIILWCVILTYSICFGYWARVVRHYLIMLGFLTGMLWVMLIAYIQLSKQIPDNLQNQPIVVVGNIVSLPDKQNYETSFLFKTEKIKNAASKKLLKLAWYQSSSILHVGEKWQLLVKVKKPHGFANPGGFDYEKWLFAEKINATGEVLPGKDNQLISANKQFLSIDSIREYLLGKMQNNLQGKPLAEMIYALTVGDRNGMTPGEWLVLQRTGTAHLMAIAGLHIGLVSGMLFFLVNFLWRRSSFLCLRIPAQVAAGVSSLLTAFIYSALAGFALPTERAVIMLAVMLLGIIFRRPIFSWHSLLIAMFVILILDPLSVLSDAFWLSFCAVGSIAYAMNGRIHGRNKWKDLIKLQWVVSLGVLPLTLLVFHQGALLSPIMNAIAIPWVGFIVVPFSLLACAIVPFSTFLAHILWVIALKNLQWVWAILAFTSHYSWVAWQENLSGIQLFFAMIAVILLLSPKGFPCRYLALFLLLPLFFIPRDKVLEGQVKFTLLDVGQGLASVVETAHHVLIFDTGPKFSPTFDTGSAVVLPFLQAEGIRNVDKIFISHGDNDHIGGVWSLIKNIPIQEIDTSVPQLFIPISQHLTISACQAGEHWQWDNVDFQVLYPPLHVLNCGNNCSCVLKVTAEKQSILLTGDIEKPAEDYLVEHEESLLHANILIAPHHGSKTSSSIDFVKAINPEFVFFPVGYFNRFHFPSTSVIQRYQNLHIRMFSTADDGAVSVLLDGKELKPEGYRQKNPEIYSNIR